MEALGVDHSGVSLGGDLEVLLDDLGRDRDDVLALPVLDQIERLQRADDVLRLDGGHLAHVLDRNVAPVLPQYLQQDLRPIAPKTQQPL